MNKFEKLSQEADENGVIVESYYFNSSRIKGLYCDGTIALNSCLETTNEKTCILAEELGHHYTSSGNILNMQNIQNIKQEHTARIWAYDKTIGLDGIVRSYERRCTNYCEMAEFLEVTEEFLMEALEYYKQKYGIGTTYGSYIIKFIPVLAVAKLYST